MSRTLLGLTLLALTLSACQATPERSPCADVDCSGHGSCVMAAPAGGGASVPTCSCDTGYAPTPSGMLCTPNSDNTLCAGIDCSGHGSCVSVKGKAQCTCDSGYQASSTGLSCSDPCTGVTCAGHGTCARTAAGAVCSCDAGYRTPLDDKTTCEAGDGLNLITYKLIHTQSTSKLGQAVLDLSNQAKGELVEQLSFSVGVLGRRARMKVTLDQAEEQVTALELEDSFTEYKVARRRWAKALLDDKGGVTTQLQRLDKLATIKTGYKGSKRPVPMLGGFEYPGWSYGCFSPLFYIQVLKRYDTTAKDPQMIEVYYPDSGQVSSVKVQAGKGSTPQKPVLDFPEWQITASYTGDMVDAIVLTDGGVSLIKHATMPADLNLSPRKAATAFTPAALPTDHTNKALSFTSGDGTKLSGTLALPTAASGTVPAVLLVSDITALDRDRPFFRLIGAPLFEHLAAHLAHAGYASLRVDPRGRGESSADTSKLTLAELAADAKAARTALAAEAGVDGAKIFVLSHGRASAALLTALKGGLPAKGYVAVAPLIEKVSEAIIYSQTRHLVLAGVHNYYINNQKKYYNDNLGDIEQGTYTDAEFMSMPVTLWKDWLAFDGKAALTAFSGPVLVLRGEEDLETSGDQVKAAQAAGKTNLSAKTLKGLTFMLSTGTASSLWEEAVLPLEVDAAAITELVTWLDANK